MPEIIDEIDKRCGAVLWWWRQAHGMSQRDVADATGWHQPKVSGRERGAIRWSVRDLLLACEALGLTPEEFFAEVTTEGKAFWNAHPQMPSDERGQQ